MDADAQAGGFRGLAAFPRYWLGVLAQFAYVGAQVGVWSFVIRYTQFNTPGTAEKVAANNLIITLSLFFAGRFIGTLLTRGTAGVVGSTTLVLDSHVTPLMLALHDGIRAGQTLAEALHAARAATDLTDPRAYPAWCSFTAYGAA